MSGIRFGRTDGGIIAPQIEWYDVAVSQTIQEGDWVVLTNVGAITRVRKLTSGDITAHYTNTSVAGILGMAIAAVSTDSSGNPTQPVPSTVAGGVQPIYPLPNIAAGMPADANNGVLKCPVMIANGWTEFLVRIAKAANATTTVNSESVGLPTGMQVVNTTDFSANIDATGSDIVGSIVGVNETDKNFAVASNQCRAYVRITGAYQQFTTGIFYGN